MITPKAASAGISGVGGSVTLAPIVIWLIELIPTHSYPYHVVLPALVAASIGGLVSALTAFVGAWLARHSEPTPEQIAQILQTNAMQQPKP